MKKIVQQLLILLSMFMFCSQAMAQDDLLKQLEDPNEKVELLPKQIALSKRIFWGEKGLLRITGLAPLTAEGREKELKIRRTMLVGHQVLGFATLGGMIAQGIVGSKLYNRNYDVKDLHAALGTGVNIAYFTTAGLAMFAPPPLIGGNKGSIKWHKILAYVHMTGMIATNVLANKLEEGGHSNLKPWHRAAAFTAFGAFAASMIVIKF